MSHKPEDFPHGYEAVFPLYEAVPTIMFSQPQQEFFKAWLLPDGTVQPTNGYHFRWLQQHPSVAIGYGMTNDELAGEDEQPVRLAAVRKGFIRLHYALKSSLLTVEAVEEYWTPLRQFMVALWITKNFNSVDKVCLHLMSPSGKLLHKKVANLFRADSRSGKVELLPVAQSVSEEIKQFLIDLERAGQPLPHYYNEPTRLQRLWGDITDHLLWWWQRRTRGFDDRVTWSLDISLADWMLPRLKRFKELNNGGVPLKDRESLTEEQIARVDGGELEAGVFSPQEWDEVIDKMIFAFDYASSSGSAEACRRSPEQRLEDHEKYVEGMRMFSTYMRALWT